MTIDGLGFFPAGLARLNEYLNASIASGDLVGLHVRVSRHGALAYEAILGLRDQEGGLPIEPDTLYRLYSMSKPIACVAALQLYERGVLTLNDPVAAYIPSYGDLHVYCRGGAGNPVTRPARRTMTIKHLLTHTSGLTMSSRRRHVTDEIMRSRESAEGGAPYPDLAAACDAWAATPLRFDPGTSWEYGVSTDVLGRVIEVASGQRLDTYLEENVTGPLGMNDTAFQATDPARLSTLYASGVGGVERSDYRGNMALSAPSFLSGGGGLVSCMDDYDRFLRMLLNGGELDGERVLNSRTVKYMCTNQLPGGLDLDSFGGELFPRNPFLGTGFGMGLSVTIDPVASGIASSVGEVSWGGLASTYFWADPTEDMSVILMTQLIPGDEAYPLRAKLKALVYSALSAQ